MHINASKLCGRWTRWSVAGHLLCATIWLQPSASAASIHQRHSLAFCWLDWRPRTAGWALAASTLFSSFQSTGPPCLCRRSSSPPSDHCSDSWGAALSHGVKKLDTRTKLKKKKKGWHGMGKWRGNRSVCLYPSPPIQPHTPIVLAGQRKWDRLVCAGHTRTHTCTRSAPDGKRVFNKMEPVSGSESEVVLCYVINSTLRVPKCDCVADLGPRETTCKTVTIWLQSGQFRVQWILSGGKSQVTCIIAAGMRVDG